MCLNHHSKLKSSDLSVTRSEAYLWVSQWTDIIFDSTTSTIFQASETETVLEETNNANTSWEHPWICHQNQNIAELGLKLAQHQKYLATARVIKFYNSYSLYISNNINLKHINNQRRNSQYYKKLFWKYEKYPLLSDIPSQFRQYAS